MFQDERGLLQGTVELLILKALSWSPTHGYGIARWIELATEDALRVEEGSLYPALHRLSAKGWVESEWGVSENNRRAKFHQLTPSGRKQLRERTRVWQRMVETVTKALAAPEHPGRGTA